MVNNDDIDAIIEKTYYCIILNGDSKNNLAKII